RFHLQAFLPFCLFERILNCDQQRQHEESAGCKNEDRYRGKSRRACSSICQRKDLYAKRLSGAQDLTHQADAGEGDGKTESHADTIEDGSQRAVLGSIALCTAKDDTVY